MYDSTLRLVVVSTSDNSCEEERVRTPTRKEGEKEEEQEGERNQESSFVPVAVPDDTPCSAFTLVLTTTVPWDGVLSAAVAFGIASAASWQLGKVNVPCSCSSFHFFIFFSRNTAV